MTIGVGHVVYLTDHDAVEVSHERALRIAAEVLARLRQLTPNPSDLELIACANNIAAGWGELGVLDPAPPEGASER